MRLTLGVLSPILLLAGLLVEAPLSAATIVAVTNGASFEAGIAPGAWISIQGSDLANVTRTWGEDDFVGTQLPTDLSGTRVRIGGRDAAVYFVSPAQINALVPADLPVGAATLTVTSPVGAAASGTVLVQPAAPGFFMFDPEQRRYVIAVHPDGTYVGKPGLFGEAAVTRAAPARGRVLLYCTGLASTDPPMPAGQQFTDARPLANLGQFSVTVDGVAATVEFAGAISPGLYQLNIVVPDLPDGDYEIVAALGTLATQPGAILSVAGRASPTLMSFQGITGDAAPPPQPLRLNFGEAREFTLEASAPWLDVQPRTGRAPGSVNVTVNHASLEPGAHKARILIAAPGGTAPLSVVHVTLYVSSTREVTLGRATISKQLLPNDFVVSRLNVLTSSGALGFTATPTSAGNWLSVSTAGRAPGEIQAILDSSGLTAGSYRGTIHVQPAGGGAAQDVDVQLSVVAPATAVGPPRIDTLLDYNFNVYAIDEILVGESKNILIVGQNLQGGTRLNFTPTQGLRFLENPQFSSDGTAALIPVSIDANATEGPRRLSLTTPRGTSNELTFQVRPPRPAIREIAPGFAFPDRFYFFSQDFAQRTNDFVIQGVDLIIGSTIQVSPSDGVSALAAAGSGSVLTGFLIVTPGATPGQRRLSVTAASNRSNEAFFEVIPAPSSAPVISNLTLNPLQLAGGQILYSGKFDFQDEDGDVAPGSRVRLAADLTSGGSWQTAREDAGKYLDKQGQTSGTIEFQFVRAQEIGSGANIPVLVSLQDAAGNISNTLRVTMSAYAF